MPHRGIDRCATPQRRPLRVILMLVAKVVTPQSPSVTAPLEGEPGGPMTSIGPYRKGVEDLGPEGVNMEDGQKASRKLQHSCNF